MEKNEKGLFSWAPKSVSSDCSNESKSLAPGRKAVTKLDSILNHRFVAKNHLVKAMVVPVVGYGYESYIIKKIKHRRTDAFELWC